VTRDYFKIEHRVNRTNFCQGNKSCFTNTSAIYGGVAWVSVSKPDELLDTLLFSKWELRPDRIAHQKDYATEWHGSIISLNPAATRAAPRERPSP